MKHEVEVQEFASAYEKVTATVDWSMPTGERYGGPLAIGVYPSEAPDIFIASEGVRVQFPADMLPTIIKQLKRAAAIAKEQT